MPDCNSNHTKSQTEEIENKNTNKTVLITGASRGIGRAIALRIAKDGYLPVLHCHKNLLKAQEVLEEIQNLFELQNYSHDKNSKVRILQFDISDRNACLKELTKDIEDNGAYYGVVCNAGITADNAFAAITGEDWDKVLNTNLNGFYNVLQPVVMPMIQARKPGRIITLSSVSGLAGNRGQVNYSASKAGIIGASKALALELAKRQITVNCIAPGLIETEMSQDAPIEEIIKHIPLRRAGKPEEVAGLASFLLSEEASYITRQVISVNGGLI